MYFIHSKPCQRSCLIYFLWSSWSWVRTSLGFSKLIWLWENLHKTGKQFSGVCELFDPHKVIKLRPKASHSVRSWRVVYISWDDDTRKRRIFFLFQTSTARCVRTRLVSPICSTAVVSPTLYSTPILSAPVVPTTILPTTTIVQSNSVTNSLVDVMSMLPVCSLLNEKLSCYSPLALPIASPVYTSCGCATLY